MYFSKVAFPTSKLRVLGNPYKLHQEVYKFFDCGRRNFIYLQKGRNLYIVSEQVPDNRSKDGFEVLTKEYNPVINSGETLRFSVKVSRCKRNDGKETTIKEPEEIQNQIKRYFERCGEVISLNILNIGFDVAKKRKFSIGTAFTEVEGVIKVSDPEALKHIAYNGIGRKKGFGLGMVTFRRAVS